MRPQVIIRHQHHRHHRTSTCCNLAHLGTPWHTLAHLCALRGKHMTEVLLHLGIRIIRLSSGLQVQHPHGSWSKSNLSWDRTIRNPWNIMEPVDVEHHGTPALRVAPATSATWWTISSLSHCKTCHGTTMNRVLSRIRCSSAMLG